VAKNRHNPFKSLGKLQKQKKETKIWPKVAIIVLNWNGWRDTIECLESLQRITYPNYQIIVVDNGSTDNSIEKIKDWARDKFGLCRPDLPFHFGNSPPTDASQLVPQVLSLSPPIVILASKENLGFSGGNNMGIEYALSSLYPADFVFLLNNDARPEQTCITACIEVAQKEDAAVVGAVIKDEKGDKVLFAGSKFPKELFMANRNSPPHNLDEYWDVDGVEGSAMLIRRDLLLRREKEEGYFLNPQLFMYCEETEFCIRARERNYRILMAKNAIVYHKVALSSGGAGNPLSYYYLTRNRILLVRELLPWWLKFLFYVWYVPSRLIRALQRRIEGKSSVSAAILEGLVDGYKGVTGKWKKHIG